VEQTQYTPRFVYVESQGNE